MRFRKIVGFIHLWLGLLSGLVIFIVALTGAIYVFQEEIDNLVHRKEYFVARQNRSSASLQTWMDSADAAFATLKHQTGGRTISWVKNANHVVSVNAGYKENNEDKTIEVLLNPYTGEVIKQQQQSGFNFWTMIVELHTSLMLGETGKYIVDVATLIALVMLVTGIVLWYPRNRNAAKQRFRFRWKEGLTWKRKNYDLHNILGFYASWIAVFIVITGLSICFTWVSNGIYFLLSGKQPVEYTAPDIKNDATKTTIEQAELAFQKATQLAATEYKTANYYYLDYPSDTSGNIYVSFSFNPEGITELEYRYFVFDRVNLQLIETTAKRKNAGDWYEVYYARIHYGSIFGLLSKLLVFFASIIVASLPITGFMVWQGRRKKRNRLFHVR